MPLATQRSENNIELDLPIVFEPTEAKRLAQRWLYISWSERNSIASAIGWKFLRLDPTDIVDFTFRGETRQLRMSELDVGADLSIEFKATQEDSRANDSVVTGQGGLGHLNQVIPSGFPSRLQALLPAWPR